MEKTTLGQGKRPDQYKTNMSAFFYAVLFMCAMVAIGAAINYCSVKFLTIAVLAIAAILLFAGLIIAVAVLYCYLTFRNMELCADMEEIEDGDIIH